MRQFRNKIEHYYVIGDLYSAALLSRNASIDWLCLPNFDSPSLFAKLLGNQGGSCSIEKGGHRISSRYIKDTAILEFSFSKEQTEFKIRDYMVPHPEGETPSHLLIRKFIGVRGKSEIIIHFDPKPNYASQDDIFSFNKRSFGLQAKLGEDLILLRLPPNSTLFRTATGYQISFSLAENEIKNLVLEYAAAPYKPIYAGQDLENYTTRFWHDWVAQGKFFNFCRDYLVRSAITLKLMQFYPTGAIVAAPTTSLPEDIGGERNWDYRYVWVRDATFTLYALYVLGYTEEATAFFNFILKITEKCTQQYFDLSLMYTIQGEQVPDEKILSHLPGYKNSYPVRVGNEAGKQFQLDVYGSLIDAYYFISKRGYKIDSKHREIIINLAEKIAETWLQKDNGIWEVRTTPQHFTYSKVMAWVGIDRTLRLAEVLRLTTEERRALKKLEQKIKRWILKNCFNTKNKIFLQHPKSKYQDATNFLFVLLQFLDKHDPLTKTILERTEDELLFKKVFVYRYLSDDGLKGSEGAFLLCSFWLVSAWAILEDTGKAKKIFTKLEKLIAKSGLLPEEIDPNTNEYLGNFPQAFSHIGFIMSAYYIHRYTLKANSLKS